MTDDAIAFQGVPGAYSDLACRTAYPGMPTLPCADVRGGDRRGARGAAELGMLPCENSLAGRVPDIHHLLPDSGLFIIGEQFQRVEHCLLGRHGATHRRHASAPIRTPSRWARCAASLPSCGSKPVVEADTAGAAQLVAEWGRKEDAAIASVAGRRDLRAGRSCAPMSRTPPTTPPASTSSRRAAADADRRTRRS